MKQIIQKLSILVAVGVTLVALTVVASAGEEVQYGSIHGLYAVTGYSTCNPNPGIFEGDYTFYPNGTASGKGTVRSISGNPSTGAAVTFTVDFMYEVTHDGRITFSYPWGGNKVVNANGDYVIWDRAPSHGVISPDGKTMTITCGPPVVLTVLQSTGPFPPAGSQRSCVTSATGILLKAGNVHGQD